MQVGRQKRTAKEWAQGRKLRATCKGKKKRQREKDREQLAAAKARTTRHEATCIGDNRHESPPYLQWQLPSSLGRPPTKWCTPAALPLAALGPLLFPSAVNLVSSGRCHNRLPPCLASLSGHSTPAAHDVLLLLSLLLLMQPMRHVIYSRCQVHLSVLCANKASTNDSAHHRNICRCFCQSTSLQVASVTISRKVSGLELRGSANAGIGECFSALPRLQSLSEYSIATDADAVRTASIMRWYHSWSPLIWQHLLVLNHG